MQIAYAETLPVPAATVWDAISAPGNLEKCHPFCARNPVHAWPGPGAHDEIHYLNGVKYTRRFREWIDGIGYDLDIERAGEKQAAVSWRIEPIDSQSCRFGITIFPDILARMPAIVRWVVYFFRLRPALRAYLRAVIGGFAWYIEHGEPVPRNHFGRHPWFS